MKERQQILVSIVGSWPDDDWRIEIAVRTPPDRRWREKFVLSGDDALDAEQWCQLVDTLTGTLEWRARRLGLGQVAFDFS